VALRAFIITRRGLELFAVPAFAGYWTGRFAGMMSMHMQALAISWLVYDLTGDPFALGLIGLVQFAPTLPLILFAGQIADRVDRRLILTVCQSINGTCAAVLLVLKLTGGLELWVLYVVMATIGAARVFEMPAGSALLPNLVPPEVRKNGLALNSLAGQIAVTLGPALGGIVYAIDPETVFALAALLNLLAVSRFRLIGPRPPGPPGDARGLKSLLAGFSYIRTRPDILGAITLDMVAVLLGGVTALLPIYAKDILMVGPVGLGILRCAPAVGGILMGLWLAGHTIDRRAGPLLFITVAAFGIFTLGFALSTNFWFSLLMLALAGAADEVSVVIRQTLVQLTTPDEVRGRVSSVNSMFIGASNQLGQFTSGSTAALFGTVPAAAAGAAASILAVGVCAMVFKRLRTTDRI
jgi:MFS family permease